MSQTIKCRQHPKYKGIKKPKIKCYGCKNVWEFYQRERFIEEFRVICKSVE